MLPAWLSIGLLSYIYAVSLIANYEMVFARIKFMASGCRVSWKVKLALIARLHFRTRALSDFAYPWTERMAAASTFSSGWCIASEFLKARALGITAADESTGTTSVLGS